MNVQTPRPPSIDLAKRFEIELLKCKVLRDLHDSGADADRDMHARLLGRVAFWACISYEELAASGAALAGGVDPQEIVAIRDTLDGREPPEVALRAHNRLRALVPAS